MILGQEQRHDDTVSPRGLAFYVDARRSIDAMTLVHFLAVFILCRVSCPATGEPTTWLMQGDLFTDEEAASRLVQPDTHKTYLPVNTTAEVFYRAQDGKLINCVIAAAVHQHGRVHVVEGGCNAEQVRVRYTTRDGRPDVFFVLAQAAKREPVSLEGNVAESTRLGIVYDSMRDWTVEEVQDSLRNVSSTFFPSDH